MPAGDKEEEEVELKDPLETLREKCGSKCTKYSEKLSSCNDRVNSRTKTTETCMEEVIDFFHCVDHCAGKQILDHLK